MLILDAGAEAVKLGAASPIPPSKYCSEGEGPEGLTTSYTITFVSDYRISGVSASGKAAALQGSIDVEHASWSGGVWASNIEEFGGSNAEIDVYAAKSFDIGDTQASLGATLIYLPGGENITIGLAEAGLARAIGPFDMSLDLRYAWPQSDIGDDDDIYVELSGASPIGRFAGAPLTLSASFGYDDGAFVTEGVKLDWSLSMSAEVAGLELGLSYVDTNLRNENGDAGCIFSVSRTF